jgi:hypothetical protein
LPVQQRLMRGHKDRSRHLSHMAVPPATAPNH